MKKHYGPNRLLTAAIALAATAIILTSLPAWHVQAIQDSEEFPPPFGLAQGQTARLTLFNRGERAIVGPEYRFLNSRGEILAESRVEIAILPGHFRYFDFDLPNPPPGTTDPFGRLQLRAVVSGIGNPNERELQVSIEVFDNATGRTSFVVSPPDPD